MAGLVIIDQWTKILALERLSPIGSIDLTPFLALTYVENRGVSFGLMQGVGNRVLLAVNFLFTIAIYFYWRKKERDGSLKRWESWGLVLVLAGALGNIMDRILRGYVIDFVDFKVWPVFNVADSCISTGVALYLLGTLLARRTAR